MSKEKAEAFVEKFWNDDAFMEEVLVKSGAINWQGKKGEEKSDAEQNQAFANAAQELGYDITPDEYLAASKAYSDNLGGFNAIKKVFHMAKIAKKARKSHQA